MTRLEMVKWGSRIAGLIMLILFLTLLSAMQAKYRRLSAGERGAAADADGDAGTKKKAKGKKSDDLPPGAIW